MEEDSNRRPRGRTRRLDGRVGHQCHWASFAPPTSTWKRLTRLTVTRERFYWLAHKSARRCPSHANDSSLLCLLCGNSTGKWQLRRRAPARPGPSTAGLRPAPGPPPPPPPPPLQPALVSHRIPYAYGRSVRNMCRGNHKDDHILLYP